MKHEELDPKMQSKLHKRLAEQLWEALNGEPCDKCLRSYPDAKWMTVIRQFLADNGTTADLRNQAPLHNLADSLPNFEDPELPVQKPGKKKTA